MVCEDCGIECNTLYCTICQVIRDDEEAEEESDILYTVEEGEDIDIGVCWCGQYGNLGRIHNRMIDGQMEECGEYL